MSRDKNSHLRLAGRPADYQKLGIDPVEVAQFEDGQRIGTEKGRYEWWYFDAHLNDGATVVVIFWTKPNVSPNRPLAPRITIYLTLPDGRRFEKVYDTTADQFTASKGGCDVRIGTNRFVGDLHCYRITAAIEEISVEIELTGEVRAWRPKSGHLYFGSEGREALFAWLPSVPQGVAHVRYKIDHEEYRASGSGYHDHNWGDVPMQTLMHNWYWGRTKAGPYTVIACLGLVSMYAINVVLIELRYIPVPSSGQAWTIMPQFLYMSLVAGAIAVLSWNMGNKIITPVNGVLIMNVVPVAAFAVSALSGIVPTPVQLAGAAITVAALVMNNLYQRQRVLSDEVRTVVEEEWPELAHKLPPKPQH
jgi:hypothetical protein